MYWVHIELVYGRALWFLKDGLTVPQTVIAAVSVILLMLAISTMKTHREKWRSVLSGLRWNVSPRADSAAGD